MNLALPNLGPWGNVCKTRNDHLTPSDRKAHHTSQRSVDVLFCVSDLGERDSFGLR